MTRSFYIKREIAGIEILDYISSCSRSKSEKLVTELKYPHDYTRDALRQFTAGAGYRYGFNGKENDNDVKGTGNQQDYGMRIYDPRLGRFLSVDPLTQKYPKLTPYQFASNRPTLMIDLDGMEGSMGINGSANVAQQQYSMVEFDSDGDWKPNYGKGWATGMLFTLSSGATVLTSGSSMSVSGFAWRPFLASMLRTGFVGSAVNTSISYVKGDNGYEMIKSAASGFFSGAALSLPWAKTLQGVLVGGGISGSVGEFTNQLFDNTFGKDKGYSLQKVMISGGVGSVANLLSNSIVDNINAELDKQLAKKLADTESSQYQETIKKAILDKSPRIGNNQLKQALNKEIQSIQKLLRKQTEVNKAAAKQAIERGVDYLQDQTNQVVQPTSKTP